MFDDFNNIDSIQYSPIVKDFDSKKNNIYFDSDMENLRHEFKRFRDIFDVIEKRWLRHDTIQIAKSVFDYCSQKEDYYKYPHHYYDFRSGDVRICVARCKNEYYVSCQGWLPNTPYLTSKRTSRGYGAFTSVPDTLPFWFEMVHDYCITQNKELF